MRYQLKTVSEAIGHARHARDRFLGAGYAKTDATLTKVPGSMQAEPGRAAVKWKRLSTPLPARFLSQLLDRERQDTANARAGPQPAWHDARESGQYLAPCGPGDRLAADGDVHASAAFTFARRLHANVRFRNRSWQQACGDLKVLWEAHDPAGPGWQSSESALRCGWESRGPEIDGDSVRRGHVDASHGQQAWQHRVGQVAGTIPSAAAAELACQGTHPHELTSWENFMDALKHGWERIRLGNDFDETGYRLHHARTYPHTNYDDIAPVYRYGNNLHRRRAYRFRSWDAAEPALRAEWERGHLEGKPLTWAETTAALHRGWDQAEI